MPLTSHFFGQFTFKTAPERPAGHRRISLYTGMTSHPASRHGVPVRGARGRALLTHRGFSPPSSPDSIAGSPTVTTRRGLNASQLKRDDEGQERTEKGDRRRKRTSLSSGIVRVILAGPLPTQRTGCAASSCCCSSPRPATASPSPRRTRSRTTVTTATTRRRKPDAVRDALQP